MPLHREALPRNDAGFTSEVLVEKLRRWELKQSS